MLGCLLRKERGGQLEYAAHLVLVAAQRAADCDAVDAGLGDCLCRGAAQVLVDAALDDAEDCLLRWAVLAMPVEAAVEPAVGALHRAGGVVAVSVGRGGLVAEQ